MTRVELTVFGKTTLDAVRLLHDNLQLDYKEAWTLAIVNHTSSDSTRKKGCPKNAFADLCRCGYVKGIQKQQEEPSTENGRMAIEALRILSKQNWKLTSKNGFWQKQFRKHHEGQLDVVLALKDTSLLKEESYV